MAKRKFSKKDAFYHETDALKGWYYQLPDIEGGRSVIYAEVTGDHGQRVIKDRPRIYYVFEGEGQFAINGKKFIVKSGDVITIPPFATYSYYSIKSVLKLLLIMDLIDLKKLPPRKN